MDLIGRPFCDPILETKLSKNTQNRQQPKNMASQQSYVRLSTKEFIFNKLQEYSRDCEKDIFVFGGYVRGIVNQDPTNDMDIAAPPKAINKFIRMLRDSERLLENNKDTERGVQPIEDPTYPVTKIVFDSPTEREVNIDLVSCKSPMLDYCDFTCNNLVMHNAGLNIRIGKKDEQFLSQCLNDTYTKTLRFMMPEHNPVRCPRHEKSPRDHPYDVPHCLGCKKFLRGLQFKLIERTHYMLKKGYTFPEDHEPLPSYFPSEITNLVFPKEESKKECENCAICMDEINTKTENCVLKCGHTFHSCCLKELISKSGEVTEYGRRDCAECPLCRKNVEIQMTCDLKAAAEEQEVIEVVPVAEEEDVVYESEEEDDVSVESNEILIMVDGSIRTTDDEEPEQPRQPRAAYRWATEGEYMANIYYHAEHTDCIAPGESDQDLCIVDYTNITELVMENFTRDTSLEDIVANLPNLTKLMLKNGGTHLTGNISCLENLEHLVDVCIDTCDKITGDISVVSKMPGLFSYEFWNIDTTNVNDINNVGTCPAAKAREAARRAADPDAERRELAIRSFERESENR